MSEKNIYQRFIEVQKKVKSVQKSETVKMNERDKGYKAVSHDDVAALLHLPLAEAGIVLLPTVKSYSTDTFEITKKGDRGEYVQRWYRTDIEITVKWINADKPDEFIESMGAAFALDTSDKSFAKAYSLALKIVLLKVHLLESRDGEEERVFEGEESVKMLPVKMANEQLKATKNHVDQVKEQVQTLVKANTPQPRPVPGGIVNNMAPATQSQFNMIQTLLDQRGIPEGDLDFLVTEGYGTTPQRLPRWVAKEIIQLLGDQNTNQGTIVEKTTAVRERRLAKART